MNGRSPSDIIRKGLDELSLSPTDWKDIRIFLGVKCARDMEDGTAPTKARQ
jgi:hypothetical protein